MHFATIDLTAFTTSLTAVNAALLDSMPELLQAALAIAGVVFAGLLLWAIFKAVAAGKEMEASRRADPEG